MIIYKRAIIVAAIEVPNNLTEEQLLEVDSDFETSIRLDLDNMQEDSDSDYSYEYDVDDPKYADSEDVIYRLKSYVRELIKVGFKRCRRQ